MVHVTWVVSVYAAITPVTHIVVILIRMIRPTSEARNPAPPLMPFTELAVTVTVPEVPDGVSVVEVAFVGR